MGGDRPAAAGDRGWSHQWRDHRQVIDGILWKLRTGAPWRDLPERSGPRRTCYDRFARRQRDGTWGRLLAHVQTKSDAVGEVEWEGSIDSAAVRARQHAAGAAGEAFGRGCGRPTTKPRLACDGRGRPLAAVPAPDQCHDCTQLAAVRDATRVPRPGGRGWPRKRPARHDGATSQLPTANNASGARAASRSSASDKGAQVYIMRLICEPPRMPKIVRGATPPARADRGTGGAANGHPRGAPEAGESTCWVQAASRRSTRPRAPSPASDRRLLANRSSADLSGP